MITVAAIAATLSLLTMLPRQTQGFSACCMLVAVIMLAIRFLP